MMKVMKVSCLESAQRYAEKGATLYREVVELSEQESARIRMLEFLDQLVAEGRIDGYSADRIAEIIEPAIIVKKEEDSAESEN